MFLKYDAYEGNGRAGDAQDRRGDAGALAWRSRGDRTSVQESWTSERRASSSPSRRRSVRRPSKPPDSVSIRSKNGCRSGRRKSGTTARAGWGFTLETISHELGPYTRRSFVALRMSRPHHPPRLPFGHRQNRHSVAGWKGRQPYEPHGGISPAHYRQSQPPGRRPLPGPPSHPMNTPWSFPGRSTGPRSTSSSQTWGWRTRGKVQTDFTFSATLDAVIQSP